MHARAAAARDRARAASSRPASSTSSRTRTISSTLLNLVDEPLATLPLERVRPGRDVLDEIMERSVGLGASRLRLRRRSRRFVLADRHRILRQPLSSRSVRSRFPAACRTACPPRPLPCDRRRRVVPVVCLSLAASSVFFAASVAIIRRIWNAHSRSSSRTPWPHALPAAFSNASKHEGFQIRAMRMVTSRRQSRGLLCRAPRAPVLPAA